MRNHPIEGFWEEGASKIRRTERKRDTLLGRSIKIVTVGTTRKKNLGSELKPTSTKRNEPRYYFSQRSKGQCRSLFGKGGKFQPRGETRETSPTCWKAEATGE